MAKILAAGHTSPPTAHEPISRKHGGKAFVPVLLLGKANAGCPRSLICMVLHSAWTLGPSRPAQTPRRSHLSVAIDQSELLVAVSELEPLPPTVTRLAQVVSSGNWSADEIEEIITLDQALAARVLSRANSAASASAVEVVRVRDAVVRIGIGPVLSLVTGHAVRGTVQPALIEYGLTEGELWRHSVASALAVEVLASACAHPLPAESFAASVAPRYREAHHGAVSGFVAARPDC